MKNGSRQERSPLLLTRVATFVAIGVVAGLALSGIPNVELVTAVCFMAGFLLGFAAGMFTGGLTEALFAGFHPMGSSIGPILIAQMAGMSIIGFLGALARHASFGDQGIRVAFPVIGLGILGTLLFDLLTNLAFPIAAGFSLSQTMISLAAGLPFAAIHIASNTLVFALIVLPLLPRLRKVLRFP